MSKVVGFLLLFSIVGYSQKQLDVFFDFNEDFPNKQSILIFTEWAVSHKTVEITKLEGYCDSVDTEQYNKDLAERRIENVLNLLEKSGMKMSKNLLKTPFGKDFKQSRIQSENRKVSVYYSEPIADSKKQSKEFSEKVKDSKKGETIRLANIYFYNNSARILPKSNEGLYELLCALQDNPKLKIEIQGHICCQQVFDLNNISENRARAVYMFLIRNKIDKNRMIYKGYGTSRPVHPIPEKSTQEEEENRRVEILILEK